MTENLQQPVENLEDLRYFSKPWRKIWKLYSENWEPSSHIWKGMHEKKKKKKKKNIKLNRFELRDKV